MFNLPNPGSNPANPFYYRSIEEQRRALQEAVTVELQFKKDVDGKKAGGKKVRDKVYKMTFKNDAEMNKFMDTNAKILDEGTEELEESTPEYRAMMKKYKGSDMEKVFKILDKEGFRMGEQSDTLVRNMLKRHRGNVKKAADQIMKDNPGMFDVNRMMMDDVQIDEETKRQNHEKVINVLTSAKIPHSKVMGVIRVPERFVRIAKEKLDDAFGGMFQKKTGFKVSGTMKEDVEIDEAEVYKRPAKVSALGGQKFHAIVANNMIVAAGMTEKEAKKMRKFGQTVLELPGAKVGQKLREGVEQVDESRDDFDYLDVEAARQDAKLEAPKVVKTRNGFQVMVYSRKVRKHIPQGQPHKTKAAAEKDAKMFEDVQLDEMIRAKDKYPEIDKIKKVMMKKGVGFYTKAGKIMVNPANVSAARDALNKAFGGQFEKKTNMEVKADKRQSVSGSARIKENVELDEMSAKQHYNKMVAQGKVGRGGRVVTPIDRDRFPNREKEGLEGPFRSRKSGQVYYYDKKAGKYYDPLSDMFLQVKDVMEAVNEEVNLLKEEVKTMDQKKAKQVYDKLKKGSEIEVDFGNMISMGGKPITLKVTSGNRIVGASRVGRIILINPENPRGMKYKLFNRDGKISLAQGDMGTILRDMKIIKEDVDQVEEKEFKSHKMYHPETGEEVDANTKADHLRFSKMGYKHDKPTK